MPKSSDFSSLPDQAILEKRFAFIDNDILKTNIVIATWIQVSNATSELLINFSKTSSGVWKSSTFRGLPFN